MTKNDQKRNFISCSIPATDENFPTIDYSPNDVTETSLKAELLSDDSAVLSFHNLTYSVSRGPPCNRKVKNILEGVSGVFQPGLNVLMGPSGAGKTSLLDVLARRRGLGGVKGDILLNGRKLPKNFNFLSGYVAQDDVITDCLTVEENLMFAANLKLHTSSTSAKERAVHQLIKELGLVKCQYTLIGGFFAKGVSGGERKRCCIGMELITQPRVIFLDEPTTGLDSTTAFSVINLLKTLSISRNTTFIFTIHQPKYSIYKLFDTLHLLSFGGKTAYHGHAQKAQEYFENLGFECEEYCNPAEFFLDVIIQSHERISFREESEKSNSTCEILVEEGFRMTDKTENAQNTITKSVPKLFLESIENKDLISTCEEIKRCASDLGKKRRDDNESRTYAQNWFKQVGYVTKRNFRNILAFPPVVVAPTILSLAFSALLGFILKNWDYDIKGYQNLNGVIFFLTLQYLFQNIPCIQAILAGREVFITESKNGYYRVSAYFVAKFLGELLPMRGIPVTVLIIAIYFFMKLEQDMLTFWMFFLASHLTSFASMGLVLFISVAAGNFGKAISIVPLITLLMVLFAGVFSNVTTLPEPLKIVKYGSLVWYSMSLLTVNQFKDVSFCGTRSLVVNGTIIEPYLCESGKDLLDRFGAGYSTEEIIFNFCGLVGFCAVFYPLTYLVMRKNVSTM